MQPQVRTIEQAINWFTENSHGSVKCVARDGAEKECNSFTEAKEFFIEHGEGD